MRSVTALFLMLATLRVAGAQEFFPPDVLDSTHERHQFLIDWYSKHIKALREPSLWELSRKDQEAEEYRFLWLRTFDHPIAVRLSVTPNGTGWLTAKMTGGHGGYEPGKLIRNRSTRLSKDQTQSFVDRLADVDFWNLSTRQREEPNVVTLDGAQWIVEGVRNGRYHVVNRTSPDPKDPVHHWNDTDHRFR